MRILFKQDTRFYPECCPAVLGTLILGKNTMKIHLKMGKRAFWMASFQCLAKSLPRDEAVYHLYRHARPGVEP